MTLIEQLVSEKIAKNSFHAANMLNVLECGALETDEARLARCRLYHRWKLSGENKPAARLRAIEGQELPPDLFKAGVSAEGETK
jgi:hypothetical protein